MKRITISLCALVALGAVAVTAPAASAQAGGTQCPTFRVLHDDQIGPNVVLPKGIYSMTSAGTLSCAQASRLFTRFLSDYDGKLPKPWRVMSQGKGKATFTQGKRPGFAVALIRGKPPTPTPSSPLGSVCPGNFQVRDDDRIGSVSFPKGNYEIVITRKSRMSCAAATRLFTRFLDFPNGNLPKKWRIKPAIATFYKPANPKGKRFRVDPGVSTNSGL